MNGSIVGIVLLLDEIRTQEAARAAEERWRGLIWDATRWVVSPLSSGVPHFEQILDPGERRGLMSGIIVRVLYQDFGVAGL